MLSSCWAVEVMHLLQAGASPFVKNSKGQVPAELCADNMTFEVLQSYMAYQGSAQDSWADAWMAKTSPLKLHK